MHIYEQDYYGFVYLWYDRARKMYCLGSHYGSLDDGYTSSTGWFREAYKRRPQDFKRRILWLLSQPNLRLLHEEEQRWLDMMKDHELSTSANVIAGSNRYYNMKKRARGGNGQANKGKRYPAPWNKGTKRSEKWIQRTCVCGALFEHVISQPKKYCNAECRPAKVATSICSVCGSSFTHRAHRARKYCSRECFGAARFGVVVASVPRCNHQNPSRAIQTPAD
jgi:hypothetical protein